MKSLALLPPLAALCSDLLFHQLPPPSPPSIASFPVPHLTSISMAAAQPARETIQARTAWRPYQLIYHPPAKSCVRGSGNDADPPVLEPCDQPGYLWYYTPQKFLTVKGTYFCLKAVGPGQPPRLSIRCDVEDSQWVQEPDGAGRTRLVTRVGGGAAPPLCLEASPDGGLLTNACVAGSDSQWFEIVTFDGSGQGSVAAAAGVEVTP